MQQFFPRSPDEQSSANPYVAANSSASATASSPAASSSAPAAASAQYDDLQAYIDKHKVKAEIIKRDVEMKTSDIAARELNTTIHQIFKSLVLQDATRKHLAIVVLPGDFELDLAAAAKALNWDKPKKIRFASQDLVIAKTGYPGGGTPPFGHREKLPVIVDQSLLRIEEGFGGGGRYEYMVRVKPQEIIRATNATVAKISVQSLAAQPAIPAPAQSSAPAKSFSY